MQLASQGPRRNDDVLSREGRERGDIFPTCFENSRAPVSFADPPRSGTRGGYECFLNRSLSRGIWRRNGVGSHDPSDLTIELRRLRERSDRLDRMLIPSFLLPHPPRKRFCSANCAPTDTCLGAADRCLWTAGAACGMLLGQMKSPAGEGWGYFPGRKRSGRLQAKMIHLVAVQVNPHKEKAS